MQFLGGKIEKWLADLKLGEKLQALYIVCVILPLVLTDGIILYSMVSAESAQREHEMENLASAVQYHLLSIIEDAAATAETLYADKTIEQFLNVEYDSPYDYLIGYQELSKNSFLKNRMNFNDTRTTIYADNETIINGGEFSKLSKVADSRWYQTLKDSERDALFLFYYDDEASMVVEERRQILFLRKLNLVTNKGCEKVVKMELNYNDVVRDLKGMNYEADVYICYNGDVVLTNAEANYVGRPFAKFDKFKDVGYTHNMSAYGIDLQIYILEKENHILQGIYDNMPLLLFIILLNIFLPHLMMKQIEKSITIRIDQLGRAFDSVENEELKKIDKIEGKDEIALLMKNYNRMADRTNELIQTVYKDKLREQEINIAKQNAELLALYSQINPHFMFNALESIRMHSILKKEYETADMVEKLAIMERQNVDWGEDKVEIRKEIDFVEAYLGLQKYRFGDRLSYSLEVEPECEGLQIPKLTIVTFVENACVHGIESKTAPGFIFVRVYKKADQVWIEVEDTGQGMNEQQILEIKDKMENASIERLQEKGRVGILNACLRLKMQTDNRVQFFIDSEEEIGTTILIKVPEECL